MTATGTLFVCAVPIGNLEDASPRLVRVLGDVDAIACEDTRTTSRLLDLLRVTSRPRLLAHHEHNERASASGLVALLVDGQDVALVSDAGTPAINDPGVALVTEAHAAGVNVVVVPGPSAVASALSVAGFGGEGYRFIGFFPRRDAERRALLARCASEVLVGFESPTRLVAMLDAICAAQPERQVAVCRELTKRHEEVVRGAPAEVQAHFAGGAKGEVVLVLEALRAPEKVVDQRGLGLVQALVAEGMRLRVASRIVADQLGGSARELYDAANAARDESD